MEREFFDYEDKEEMGGPEYNSQADEELYSPEYGSQVDIDLMSDESIFSADPYDSFEQESYYKK